MDNIIKRCPNEIIQEVATYLSTVDKLSFALVHPIFYRSLGRDSWEGILNIQRWKRGQAEKPVTNASVWDEFLSLTRRAFPGYWWCDKCVVLHPHDISRWRTCSKEYEAVDVGPGGEFKECKMKLDPAVVMAITDRHFKGEKYGRCKEYLLGYRWFESSTRVQFADMNMRAEFRACQLVWQGRWDFSWSGEDIPRLDDVFSFLREAGFRFCRHLIWKQPRVPWIMSSTPLESFMRCHLRHSQTSAYPCRRSCQTPEVFSCRHCSTYLTARVRRIHNLDFRSVQVTINIKKNFGAGEYGKDSEFQNHFSKKHMSKAPATVLTSGEHSEPLFYQCDEGHGLDCCHVRSCAHESRDPKVLGKKPTKIDSEGGFWRALRLRGLALG